MGQQDFLKQYAKEICTFFENISDHCDIYEAICVCQQTQQSKEKMSWAEYDKKKNYIHKSKFFLIWISRSFKKGASDNTISYFD